MNEKSGKTGKAKTIICTTVLVETSPQAMPLGAACIASAIKANEKFKDSSVKLIDFSREDKEYVKAFSLGEKEAAKMIARKIAEEKPFAVCFSVYVWNHTILDETADELKKILPNVVCIAGGPEVTANPKNFVNFDYTIAGQGEIAVPALLESLIDSDEKSNVQIPGIYCSIKNSLENKSETESENNENVVKRAVPCSPELTPSPYLDGTLDPAKYGGALWELARGCPFKCSYCYESKGEKKIAYFPMERLEKEIELFAKKKIAQVFVLDPTYNASKERALKMLKTIEKKAPGMFFYFEARAEFIDRELAKAFSRIPCCIQFGLQSANPDVLKKVHRTLDKKLFARNIGFLNDEGVTFGFDLIYGLPTDNLQGFKDSIDFALSLYPNNLELFCLSVLPGTNLHDDAAGYGMIWDEKPPYHVIRTPEFSEEDLFKAEKLARATNIFYTQGRAVPWFNSVLYPLKEKASAFLWDFAKTLETSERLDSSIGFTSEEITEMQKSFVRSKYKKAHLEKLIPIAEDLILMHGALGRCTFDGSESTFTTNYHPDDVMSEYATDLAFFAKAAGKEKCRVRVFESKNGPDWKTVK